MSKPYQLVVFDWEGTISDTLGQILHTVAAEIKALGYGEIEPYQARQYVGLGLVHALRKLLPHLTEHQHQHIQQAVQQAMTTRPNELCLLPGALEFIQQLRATNIDIAIATNKGQHSLQRALQATGLDDLFHVTRSAGQVPAKPCPQMLEEIMGEFGKDASSTLMIGDSVTDMEMAHSIKVDAIGVDFYHQQDSALTAAGALAVFDDYSAVANFLNLPKN